MKRYRLFLMLLLPVMFSSCATELDPQNIYLEDYVQPRAESLFLEPQKESDSPEKGLYLVDHYYYKNYEEAFNEAIAYGNYYLSTWYETDYASQIANRLAWISLFLVDDQYGSFPEFDENIYHFCRSLFFINKSITYDEEEYWVLRGADFKTVLDYGYSNLPVLSDYLTVKRMVFIEIPMKRDLGLVLDAIERLKYIRARYPDWLPNIVQADLEELITFYEERKR
jgi:hypothetical protein